MEHINSITKVTAATFPTPSGDYILLNAQGTVTTSGWSGFSLR